MRRNLFLLAAAALLAAPPVSAQDIQPGRNFPTAAAAFGTGRSENVDVGDIDGDGDFDVLVANGGDGAAQQNTLYRNNGGSFTDVTPTQYPALLDTSRDCEFADIDNDTDLDIYISNRGGSITGEVSRFFDNNGTGFFAESSNSRWGALVSVPAGDQVFGGNQGPWRDWSCDCDFGDLDLDGDLDLFHSSYGPNIGGNRPSRVFLNDGGGTFDEIFPWASAGADINWHTLDIDLADFDEDFDLDIAVSSRNSQARFFENNLVNPNAAEMFTDTTAAALLAGAVTQTGSNNYESEYADLDGDGDFDIWFKNLKGNEDKIAQNNGNAVFTIWDPLINDPVVDENEVDFLDYDGDGDLDAYAANFSGTNWLYRSTVAQGGTIQYRRTDAGTEPPELPSANNGGTSLDGECADMDGDGDEDILVANDSGQQNRYLENALGIPDTFAPTFFQVETVADKATGPDARVIAQVRDNSNYYVIGYYAVELIYTVNGGAETSVGMFSQAGQQFMGFIPGTLEGTIAYRVEATDRAGNTGVSATQSFMQGAGGTPGSWTDLGLGKAGTNGVPVLAGTGTLQGGSSNQVDLTSALASAPATLFVGLSNISTPFKGGTLVPSPDFLINVATNGAGAISLPFTWPAGIPLGTKLYWQIWVSDSGAANNLSASNGLESSSGSP